MNQDFYSEARVEGMRAFDSRTIVVGSSDGVKDWQRPQQKRLGRAEDHDVGANPETKTQDSDMGEPRHLTDLTVGMMHVSHEILKHTDAPGIAMRFAHLVEAAERDPRLADGLRTCDA